MFVVTRQCYWPDGDNVVEISRGGIDYTGPDAYSPKYPDEMVEIANPIEAVEAGLAIAKAWKNDFGQEVGISFCANADMCQGEILSIEDAEETFQDIAKRLYDKLEKCDFCGEIIGDKKVTNFETGEVFCNEYCGERSMEHDEACYE